MPAPPPATTNPRRGSLSHLLPPTLLALLLLGLITLVSLHSSRRYALDMQWVTHTHLVLEDLAALRADAAEARAGRRGADRAVDADVRAIRRLTSDNPSQQRRLDGVEAALAPARAAPADDAWWGRLVRALGAMTAEERRLLSLRANRADAAGRTSQTLVLSAAAVVLALLVLGAALVVLYGRDRGRAEEALLSVQAALRGNVRALGESEALFRSVLASMQEGLLVHDAAGATLLCNARAEQLFGLPPGALLGTNALSGDWAVIREDGTPLPSAEFPSRSVLATGRPAPDMTLGLHKPDGGLVWLQVSATPLRREGEDQPYGVVLTSSDVSARRDAQTALRAAEEKYRGLYENSTDGMFQSSAAGRLLGVNPATARMLGYESSARLLAETGGEARALYHRPEDRGALLERLAAEDAVYGFETPFRRRDGGVVWVSLNVRLGRDAGGGPFLEGSINDITERRAAEQRLLDYNEVLEFQKREVEKANDELEEVNGRLEALATQDGLTGLKNHRAFQDRLAEEVARARRYGTPLSLVMLDVDCFKQYNDAFGHPAGDEVLLRVAAALRHAIRESDYAARYGGEEFVLILPQTDAGAAALIAERCRATLEAAAWERRAVTASFGVAPLLPSHHDGAALLADADRLLYRAKAGGRNRVASSEQAAPAGPDQPGRGAGAGEAVGADRGRG